jgi:hypothetical protein
MILAFGSGSIRRWIIFCPRGYYCFSWKRQVKMAPYATAVSALSKSRNNFISMASKPQSTIYNNSRQFFKAWAPCYHIISILVIFPSFHERRMPKSIGTRNILSGKSFFMKRPVTDHSPAIFTRLFQECISVFLISRISNMNTTDYKKG